MGLVSPRLAPDSTSLRSGHGFGTAPVFLASVSTILGAILFLRFGYAVANVGLWGTMIVILVAHLVTIPTVLAVSEIATNRRVAGGGAYFIISRSFGTSIGGTIGIALYLSQAISVAFYLVAFAEAFQPVIEWLAFERDFHVDLLWISLSAMILMGAMVIIKGASVGMRALWVVCAFLAVAILAFFLGEGPESIRPDGLNVTATIEDSDSFGTVFATCFPAFTGMIAGLGLSGDLKNPQRSIPLGTIAATLTGMLIYAAVAIKLALSATPEALMEDQFVMAQIAIWGPVIYLGLGAAALSSAIGSILVAPRTLQSLARDNVLPVPQLNRVLESGRGPEREPVLATVVTSVIAVCFVVAGGIDFIAQILSMFFMVTYGALCTVSFLEYFAGNPSYRPTFQSRWYLSLLGAIMCGLMMIRMNLLYASLALIVMVLIYLGLRRSRRSERDLTAIFQGTMFQLTRRLQIAIQKNRGRGPIGGWRPSIITITRFGERRLGHFDLLRWICHRHGFGHFIQYFQGEYSFADEIEARTHVDRLIERAKLSGAGIFVDSLISPSFNMAVSQTLQMPGISGLPNNCALLEFDGDDPAEIEEVAQGASIATESMFNVLILRSTQFRFGYRASIHVWVTEHDLDNVAMMLLFAYIIVGHPDWRRAQIRLFACSTSTDAEREADDFSRILVEGRLPISKQNITPIRCDVGEELERQVTRQSASADLVIAGVSPKDLEPESAPTTLMRFASANDVLFVRAVEHISIS